MDPRIETCRRWMKYQARRVVASIFNDSYAPKERLLRRDRLIDTALATKAPPAEERAAAR
ncbi:MAG: hypothetical protein ICV87_09880 [Gemmatimonadetes bacterium]|nr:hypothetical protein [Gemmatimonadota bacterium]